MKRAPAKPIKLEAEQIGTIESAVFALVEKQLDAAFYLLAVNFEKESGYWYLRVYVEGQAAPIALSDCEQISRTIDPQLETLPELKDLSYSLEVSSPGLFRPLRTEREFAFYHGRPVRVESKPGKKGKPVPLKAPEEGQLEKFDEAGNLLVLKKPDGKTVEVALTEDLQVLLNPEIHFPDEESNDGTTE